MSVDKMVSLEQIIKYCRRMLLLLAWFATTTHAWTHETQKLSNVVSINMCADGLLLALADHAQIASLSYLSGNRNNVSWADTAATYPLNHGQAEEVLFLSPDLVLASQYTAQTTLMMLRKLGVSIVALDVPYNFEGIRAQMRLVGNLIGQQNKTEAIIHAMDAQLDMLAKSKLADAKRAIVLQENGVVAGKDTLPDSILVEAGLVNIAALENISGYKRMQLETIVGHKPDFIIIDTDHNSSPARASLIQQHPAIRALVSHGMRIITFPSKLWRCAGPETVAAIQLLHQKVQEQ